jgi:hypothetical protein
LRAKLRDKSHLGRTKSRQPEGRDAAMFRQKYQFKQ